MTLEGGAVELLNVPFPHLAGIHIERVVVSGRLVRLEAATQDRWRPARRGVCLQPGPQSIRAVSGRSRRGRPGTDQLDAARSRTTLLRLVRSLPEPTVGSLRAVGVDEFALRRGHSCGTLLVDMDTRRPVDVLDGRTSTTLAAWLENHPGVEIVCRDRAGPYA